ncbi:hypothetical protein BS78_K216400 [Paspalum vaginatum]|uniref:Uncharacterized protein n=1 Tax=Paspalum vaginatum TaxID=158149 RepID=A0A9W7X7Q0_9POAL|nr:hypothetical protein BS78_K216400 [Paspalum vaginatum]
MMRFLARWINMVVVPRDDTRCMTVEDLKILYCMWHRPKYAPMHGILYHWLKLAHDENAITIKSFMTRIASELGVLANVRIEFLPQDTLNLVIESNFIQAHFLCKTSIGNLVMTYKGYKYELLQPVPQFKLYSVNTLSMPIEAPRHSVAGVMTRAHRRAAKERMHKAQEDAQATGTRPTSSAQQAGQSGQTQGDNQSWHHQDGSWHSSWEHSSTAT